MSASGVLARMTTPPGRFQALTPTLEAKMATPDQVANLRPLINDTVQPFEFANETLVVQLDQASGDLRKAASSVWTLRASKLAGLVDVAEGSSSRKLSQLYAQALAMADRYAAGEDGVTPTQSGRTRLSAIVRR